LFEVGAIHESPLLVAFWLAGRYTQGCLILPSWIPACAGMTWVEASGFSLPPRRVALPKGVKEFPVAELRGILSY
jgi:hypothetical protein